MPIYTVSKTFKWRGLVSEKVAAVMRMFGLSADRLAERAVTHKCTLEVRPGDIVHITGPSGSGKSVLLRELQKKIPACDRIDLGEIELPGDRAVIDCIDADLVTALQLLSTAGLGDAFCILNQPANLSDGEKWRFRLAMALAAKKKFVFADEFCSQLDRIAAAVIAYNIRKFARRSRVTFFLAASCDDLLTDLEPDVLIVKELSGPAQVIYKERPKVKV